MQIKIIVEFNTDNATFHTEDGWYEFRHVGEQISKVLQVSTLSDFKPTKLKIRDCNGNPIGTLTTAIK